jgi:hypothetical protein
MGKRDIIRLVVSLYEKQPEFPRAHKAILIPDKFIIL